MTTRQCEIILDAAGPNFIRMLDLWKPQKAGSKSRGIGCATRSTGLGQSSAWNGWKWTARASGPLRKSFRWLGPDDVVLSVEGHEHETGEVGFAREPVHDFAGHQGKTGPSEQLVGHAVHAREDVPPDHKELLFGGVVMRGSEAAGRRFEKKRGRAGIGIAVLPRDFWTCRFPSKTSLAAARRVTTPRCASCAGDATVAARAIGNIERQRKRLAVFLEMATLFFMAKLPS
jgi:hypothetical protein